MGYSEFDPATQSRAAWNAGKAVGTKRPLTQKQIWAIRFFLDREGRLRDRALFDRCSSGFGASARSFRVGMAKWHNRRPNRDRSDFTLVAKSLSCAEETAQRGASWPSDLSGGPRPLPPTIQAGDRQAPAVRRTACRPQALRRR